MKCKRQNIEADTMLNTLNLVPFRLDPNDFTKASTSTLATAEA